MSETPWLDRIAEIRHKEREKHIMLIIEALRFAERVSILLNELATAVGNRIEGDDDHRFDDLHEMLRRRFSDCSGLPLFIAADILKIDLPQDLRSEPREGDE